MAGSESPARGVTALPAMPRLRVSPGSCCSSRPFPLGDHSPGGSARGFWGSQEPAQVISSDFLPRELPLPFPRCPAVPLPAGTLPMGSALSGFPFPASGPGLGLPHRRAGRWASARPLPSARGWGGPRGARGRAGFGPRCPPHPPLVSPPRSIPGPGPPAPRVLTHPGVSPGSGLCL